MTHATSRSHKLREQVTAQPKRETNTLSRRWTLCNQRQLKCHWAFRYRSEEEQKEEEEAEAENDIDLTPPTSPRPISALTTWAATKWNHNSWPWLWVRQLHTQTQANTHSYIHTCIDTSIQTHIQVSGDSNLLSRGSNHASQQHCAYAAWAGKAN